MEKYYVLNVHDYSVKDPSCDSTPKDTTKDDVRTCKRCDKTFFNASSLKRHVLRVHEQRAKYSGGIRCTACKQKMISRDALNEHLQTKHNVVISTENRDFKDFREFQTWKQSIETDTQSSYVMTRSNVCKGKKLIIYSCHRSGFHQRLGEKRNLKKNGSNKINGTCPAYIQTIHKANGDGEVNVRYVSTHHGHTNEVDRLRLTYQEKIALACKLEQGVPQVELLAAVQENFNPSKRMCYTTKKDLHNIRASLTLKSRIQLDPDDAAQVDQWVDSCCPGSPDCPILAYKPIGLKTSEFPSLSESEFFLAFMNDVQVEIFKNFGKGVVVFDSNCGTNLYGIQLLTLMVVDEECDGFPFAFLYSVTATQDIYLEFFKLLKEKLPVLSQDCFMTDGSSAAYEAWTKVFGSPVHKLLSSLHVKRSWNQHLNSKILKPEKRDLVQTQLYSLLEELDKKDFAQLLGRYSRIWSEDDGTRKFSHYFETQYAKNCAEWAYCYRGHLQMTADGCVERWHNQLKTSHENEENDGEMQMEGAIRHLIHCLNRMFLMNNVSILGEKLNEKVEQLQNSHKNSLSLDCNIHIVEPGKKWIVSDKLSEEPSQMYTVEIVNEIIKCGHCQLVCELCGICVHCMSCSCVENQTKFYICEHIHLVCQYATFGQQKADDTPCEIATVMIDDEDNVVSAQSGLAEVIQTVVIDDQLEAMRSKVYLKAIKLLETIQNCTTEESLDFIRNSLTSVLTKVDDLEKSEANKSQTYIVIQ